MRTAVVLFEELAVIVAYIGLRIFVSSGPGHYLSCVNAGLMTFYVY
jgi:hypothetical protein